MCAPHGATAAEHRKRSGYSVAVGLTRTGRAQAAPRHIAGRPRKVFRVASAAIALILIITTGFLGSRFWHQSHPPQHGIAVVIDRDGTVQSLTSPEMLAPHTRVVVGGPGEAIERQRNRVKSSVVPVIPELGDTSMFDDAILDIATLGETHGVVVAGWESAWRYVWPRDTAFVVSALARSGQLDQAAKQLAFLQSVQPANGVFQARYTPDGSGPPDDRGVQLDGTGWALWATSQLLEQAHGGRGAESLAQAFKPLYGRSVAAIRLLTQDGTVLPPVSADYWEVRETRVTLATCAILLAGLRSGSHIAQHLDDSASRDIGVIADRFERLVLDKFAADGFPRRVGGSPRSVDLGVSFLMEPFAGVDRPDVRAAWLESAEFMHRPAGGLAPGGSWRRDGVSWTTSTAAFAVVEACQADRSATVQRLAWLDRHRTSMGALPEKVRSDGTPAGPAPLAWASSAVLISADLLTHGC